MLGICRCKAEIRNSSCRKSGDRQIQQNMKALIRPYKNGELVKVLLLHFISSLHYPCCFPYPFAAHISCPSQICLSYAPQLCVLLTPLICSYSAPQIIGLCFFFSPERQRPDDILSPASVLPLINFYSSVNTSGAGL